MATWAFLQIMDKYPSFAYDGFLSTNLALSSAAKAPDDGIMTSLGSVLNALVSQSRALTAQAAVSFHAELQPAAFHIALWLNAFGPAKPSALAQAVGMDRSAASRLTRDLVRLGLIDTSMDPSDRRSIVLSLTANGRRRMNAAMQAKGNTFRQRVASWSEQDLLVCTNLLQRLLDVPANADVESS
jgi:DNA-binding MarR family transcriptional regulator